MRDRPWLIPSWFWRTSQWLPCHQGTASEDVLSSQFYPRVWCTLVCHCPGRSGWCQNADLVAGTPAVPQRSGQRRSAADCSHGADRCSEGLQRHGDWFMSMMHSGLFSLIILTQQHIQEQHKWSVLPGRSLLWNLLLFHVIFRFWTNQTNWYWIK